MGERFKSGRGSPAHEMNFKQPLGLRGCLSFPNCLSWFNYVSGFLMLVNSRSSLLLIGTLRILHDGFPEMAFVPGLKKTKY